MTVETLTRADLKALLLDACSDAELQVLIDHLDATRADLAARLIVAPADADAQAQALACEVSAQDFRDEQARRARLSATQRRAEEVARKSDESR